MDFPRHCHKPGGLFVVVTDQAQFDAVAAQGWAERPAEHVERPVQVSYADAVRDGFGDQAPEAPSEDAPAPKKRGRPKG